MIGANPRNPSKQEVSQINILHCQVTLIQMSRIKSGFRGLVILENDHESAHIHS